MTPPRVLVVEHPDGGGPGVFGDVDASFARWRAWLEPPPVVSDFDVVVLYGGSSNVVDDVPWLRREIAWLGELLDQGKPVLGLCLGGQLLSAALGGSVVRSTPPEIGWHPAWLTERGRADPVLSVFDEQFVACQWHSWMFSVPPGGEELARSAACVQAFRHGPSVGVQFHPEVDRPTLERWIADWRNDPDAVEPGFDPEHARREMDLRLAAWNEVGRRLFVAFLRTTA